MISPAILPGAPPLTSEWWTLFVDIWGILGRDTRNLEEILEVIKRGQVELGILDVKLKPP